MKWQLLVKLCVALTFSSIADLRASENSDSPLNLPQLAAIDGKAVDLTTAKFQVYCVLGTECPVSRFYTTRLDQLSRQYADQGVYFVGVHSNLHDSEDDIRKFTEELGVTFPQVHDTKQAIARALQATRIPEVILMDQRGKVRYRGRIDDQYSPGVRRAAPTANHLQRAIDLALAGKEAIESRTEPVGCLITFEKPPTTSSEVTFCKSIAPLFNQHCVECHRVGEIGPFDISNYEEVRGWAEMILEVVEQKRMPPWHADPDHGSFKNSRHMPEEAVSLLKRWVKAGTPYGQQSDLPPKPEFIAGWRLPREPDLVVSMRDKPYIVPADGNVDYQYFVVDPQIKEDRWVSAAQVIPGSASVVHHAIVFVRPPDGVEFQGVGWLTAYVPGQRATAFPAGFARKIPAGSKFVFQMHYTPNGHEQADLSRIGMTFLEPSAVTHEVFTMVGIDQEFEIPPGASDHAVTGSVHRLPRNGQLLAIMPHMHLRGKSFELTSVTNHKPTSQARDVVLKVPQYDFNWQHTYELSEPLSFDNVESLEFITTFDNSTSNPFNPAPEEYVVWGDQTWEEMAVAFLEVARPITTKVESNQPTSAAKVASVSDETAVTNAPTNKEDTEFAAQFLAKFDSNKDGRVERAEASRIVKAFSFNHLDKDNNGTVTKEELIEAARTQRGK